MVENEPKEDFRDKKLLLENNDGGCVRTGQRPISRSWGRKGGAETRRRLADNGKRSRYTYIPSSSRASPPMSITYHVRLHSISATVANAVCQGLASKHVPAERNEVALALAGCPLLVGSRRRHNNIRRADTRNTRKVHERV